MPLALPLDGRDQASIMRLRAAADVIVKLRLTRPLLAQVLLALPLNGRDQVSIKRLRAAADAMQASLADRVALKDAGAVAERLAALDATPGEPLGEEELQVGGVVAEGVWG